MKESKWVKYNKRINLTEDLKFLGYTTIVFYINCKFYIITLDKTQIKMYTMSSIQKKKNAVYYKVINK